MASLPITFTKEAEREAREAFRWYHARNHEAADRFEVELVGAIERIAAFPRGAAEIEAGVRRLLFRRFPYGVLYSIEPDRIVVLAVMHTHRRPGYWRGRKA